MSLEFDLNQVSIADKGPTISLTLNRRQTLSLFGPAGSGKSRLLRVCAGLEKPIRGAVRRPAKTVLAEPILPNRKTTPMSLAQGAGGRSGPHAAEALGALRLWDVRKSALTSLSPGQALACSLLPALSHAADLVLIDGLLDTLDIWALRDVTQLLQKRVAKGAMLVVATQRPEWARMTDAVLVLDGGQPAFVGSFHDLIARGSPASLEVETTNQEGVRALCEPFTVALSETADGVCMRAQEGQELAVRLLLEGYGDVKSVVVRSPDSRELLEGLIR